MVDEVDEVDEVEQAKQEDLEILNKEITSVVLTPPITPILLTKSLSCKELPEDIVQAISDLRNDGSSVNPL